ncbi:basic amino acid ABC transporter substrate-binding protein [Thermoanaerobacterium thermosaccharolyticum]|uniref:basic amino acid ABC transporter substrate-binding protein n=1 Tax=Thermoanaerobacterium thermosaccharolyticum TaxID=1517 RepID=UPI001046DA2A|nr:basic amino acid ABC transporter substrate-binding protein [Thermoanaerobacterium thermosaccharolyticum]KAA5805852.1 basic amino acid ABC transporter substrate-binding protein [Thermoanaerobacterium thermosaccharolyticum]TCW42191.1 amino acid ABC transporter substrate-binding protein (PAAT family) [Thermohydrogenium kirishiense]
MKKVLIISLSLIVMLSIILSGCSKQSTLSRVKKSGVIVMGTSADFPPFEFHKVVNGKDTIMGFDVDLANAIAKKLGVKLEIKDMDFTGLIPALQSGQIDMAIAGMNATPDRKKNVDFSDEYYNSEQVLVVKSSSLINNLKDLDGKTVAVQLGTTSDDAAKKIKGIDLKELNRLGDAFLSLENGRVDAILMESTIANAYLKEYKDMEMLHIKEINEAVPGYSVAVAKGNQDLVNQINSVIKELKDSGEYDKMLNKWMGK